MQVWNLLPTKRKPTVFQLPAHGTKSPWSSTDCREFRTVTPHDLVATLDFVSRRAIHSIPE